jgi:hypothetical protein
VLRPIARLAAAAAIATACSDAARPAPPPPPVPAGPGCVVELDHAGHAIRINGVAVPDFAPARLRRLLGAPDRVVRTESRQAYEEAGATRDEPWTSTMVTVIDDHYVYDRLGLVFRTASSGIGRSTTPEVLLLFFASPRRFDNTAAPAVAPAHGGGCRLVVDGVAVDPAVDARPPGVTYRTESFAAYHTRMAPTSIATVIDGIYSDAGAPSVRIYLDAPASGRPAYAEIR